MPRLPSKNTCQSFCQNFSFCASKVGMEKQTELGISRSSSRRCCCCHRRRCRNANTCAPLAKSATRPVWPDGQIAFSKFGHFYNNETLPNCMTKNWPKYDQYFSKILNKPSNVCQRLRFCQSGKCLPNLVTLGPNCRPLPSCRRTLKTQKFCREFLFVYRKMRATSLNFRRRLNDAMTNPKHCTKVYVY